MTTTSTSRPVWLQEVLNSYEVDLDAQTLLQKLAISAADTSEYSLEKGVIKHQGRIWIGANQALRTKLISAFHASAVGGHSGIQATYQRVRKLFVWTGLKQDIIDFVHQ